MTAKQQRIVISEFIDEEARLLLGRHHHLIADPKLVDDPPRLLQALHDADALIVRNRTQVNAALLAAAPKVRVVGRLGVGLDNIDLATCHQRNIEVIPATGANAQSVAEYVIATIFLLLRGAFSATASVAAGQWPRAALSSGREIGGKTLGLVGFGSIGQTVARLAKGLGMKVIAFDPLIPAQAPLWRDQAVTPVGLEALGKEADVVSLHLPLVKETKGLFDAARLGALKQGSFFINTARGGIVDEAALADLLKSDRLAGAALDVFASEPLPANSPLAEAPNLILTPHIAGITVESNHRVSLMIAQQVLRALEP